MASTLIQPVALERQRTPQDLLLSNVELPLRGIFYPLGYAVEIATNEPAVLDAASESFGHMRLSRRSAALQVSIGVFDGGDSACPPEPTRRQHNHLYSLVADVDNQALLDLHRCISYSWLTKAAVANRLYFRYNFLEKTVYLLLGSSVVTDLHAACVGKNGRGILLCGDSGAGKSTLSFACARAGWTYTSDDTSYLINESGAPRVIGHSHRMRFRPTAKALFPELEGRELTPRMEGKPSLEVSSSEFPGLTTANETDVHAVVYLNRGFSAGSRLIQLPAGTATQRMRQELYSTGEIRAKHERSLEKVLNTPAYELRYHDLDHAIDQLDRLAQRL
jgi:hypothetical protein